MNKLCGSTMLERRDLQIHPFLEQLLNSHCILLFLQGRVCAPRAESVMSDSRPHGLQPARLLCPWNFPGKNTGVGCHFLLQGIFPTQGSKPCLFHLLHWQADSLPLHHLRSHTSGRGQEITSAKGQIDLYIHYINSYTVYEVAQSCLTLRSHGLQPTRLLSPWNFPGKSIGVGCHFLLQGIFPTRGSNLGLLHCRQTLYHLSRIKQHIVQALGTIRQSPFQLLNPVIAPREQP